MIFIELTYSTIRSGTNKTFDINPHIIKTMTEYQDEDGTHRSTKIIFGCDSDVVEVDETKAGIKDRILAASAHHRIQQRLISERIKNE